MIPVRLKTRNFMCYRGNMPPLSFDGVHTACICGDNGNGKSALIDAMTWALWGKTRATSDDELISQGQPEMEVEFDFAVGEQPYRIIRKHSKPKRRQASGQSSLDLLIASDDSFKVISGDRITQTQQKIKDILHMDYETFINSAFLRQGHADEFTRQPPTRRKEVLASILDLSFYDELEEKAKNLAREQEAEREQLESTIRDISDELAQKEAYQAELEQAQVELSSIEGVIKEQESRLNRQRQEKESLHNKELQLAQLEEGVAKTEKELKRWDDQLKQHQSRLKEYEELIARRAAIEEGYARFIRVKKSSDELDHKLRLVTRLNERRHQLEMAITQAGQELVKDHAIAQNRIAELEAASQKLPQIKNELQQMQSQWQQLTTAEEALNKKRQSSQELGSQVHSLETGNSRLKREISELEEKLSLFATESDARCPLCETELGVESRQRIEAKYAADRDKKSDCLKSGQNELTDKKGELESGEGEVKQLEAELNQNKASAQGRVSLLNKEMSEAEGAKAGLDEARGRLSEIEQHLASKDFATTEQEALDKVEGELAEIGYDRQQHEQTRQRLTSLEEHQAPKRKLEEAERLVSQEREAAARAEQATQELRHSLEADNQKGQSLTAELSRLPQLLSELAQTEAEHQALTAQQKGAAEAMWNVKAKLEHCAQLEIKRKQMEKRMTQASKQAAIYKELAQAFGKRGIQALLIEMALPEIEVEANKLLARMTDNRMHVKFETQRLTKKGDLIETLDINISDELGVRNYEMFSGGEAFRINFAIRVALSRLLARRAGAPLRTLIIDEGFGTQDSGGMEKIKEAINSIQEDFDKIIVITHIEELKDAFPTRIDVIKTATGSTISVN
ncbi:MAG: SMC family ATPase [Dehalococcoidia bacterium]|nr:MAG: SMC family ATPase [Dehalococcoidia bacterium]